MRPKPIQDIEDLVFFGPFRLSAAGRLLERNGKSVAIGARALDILIVLVEQAGQTVSQQDLLASVWPNLNVAESALRVHINKLRQVLGEADSSARYVQNVPGRGYRFVEPVSRLPTAKSWTISEIRWVPQQRLPPAPIRMVGRDAIAEEIATRVRAHRFITIVGPGGVGKTTLCVAVCYSLVEDFDGKVIFVDLGAISDPQIVLAKIRSALQISTGIEALPLLVAVLRGHRLLLVLDCCEHVADEVALIAERIFQDAEGCHLLLTSREPMHCDGEQVFSVPPLPVPVSTEALTAREALAYPAVKLFVDSVSARDQGFQLQNAEAPIAASICQRVDGIALALELAAGRVSAFGLAEVHRQLDGRMKLLWQGRRTAPPRQQTLSATLDWSFKLLSPAEQLLLCRLSIFVGTFTLEDARAVAADAQLSELEISQHLGSLVDRCLIAVDLTRPPAQYRLLDMTREFARDKIATVDEVFALARRHAEYFLQVLTDVAGTGAGQMPMRRNVPPATRLGNVHAALEWCLSPDGARDRSLGLRLVAASGNFLLSQGLTMDCRTRANAALARLGAEERGTRLELDLLIVLASTHTLADYPIRAPVIDRAIALARALGERRLSRTLLYDRLYDQAFWGQPEIALQAAFAARAELAETDDPIELAIAEATIACISHTYGADDQAYRHFITAFSHVERAGEKAHEEIDEQAFRRMRATRTNNLYTCGFFDQAARLGEAFIDEFETSKDYPACAEIMPRISFIFEWMQEWHMVARIYNLFVKIQMDQPSDRLNYVVSVIWCRLLMVRGEFKESVARLEQHLAEVPPLSPGRFLLYAPMCDGLTRLGRFDEALAIIDEALDYESTFAGTGFRSEYLLQKARILMAMRGADPVEIENLLRLSLAAAVRQTSLSRELDAALALAQLLHGQHRPAEARAVLQPVYDRFTEGFATKVMVEARELLDKLGPPPERPT